MSRIITHGGKAHRDDLASVCLALAINPNIRRIDRRDPTETELEDPEVLVLDVGGRHEPDLSNFDHHQRGRGDDPECALSLWSSLATVRVGDSEERLRNLLENTKWFQTTVELDVRGPFAVAKSRGISPGDIFALGSPVEGALLGLFEQATVLLFDGSMFRMMAEIGHQLLDQLIATELGRKAVEADAKICDLGGVEVTILSLEDISGLSVWRERRGMSGGMGVWPDDRGPGWALFRHEDDPRVDLSVLEGAEGVNFAHRGGFIAKTEEMPIEQALELARRAIKRA